MNIPPKPKRPPHLFTVSAVRHLTPNMIRITFAGVEISRLEENCEGANCKLFLPDPYQSKEDFAKQLIEGPRPIVRTYSVRFLRKKLGEMDIDFVDHGDAGPASAWARAAKVGSFCGFAGPGAVKLSTFYAERYLVVADMSALPVAAATLEAMPRNAVGDAFFDIIHADDRQEIGAPKGIRQHWLVNENPHNPTGEITALVKALELPTGALQTCIAGESGMIKDLRAYLQIDCGLPKEDTYISGYWKIGLIEDEHQKMKRAKAH